MTRRATLPWLAAVAALPLSVRPDLITDFAREPDLGIVVCLAALGGLAIALRGWSTRDLVAGLLIGATIEFWGTRSAAWSFYTGEEPPLWIAPAWALLDVATIAVTAAVWHRCGPATQRAIGMTRWPLLAVAAALLGAFCIEHVALRWWLPVGAVLVMVVGTGGSASDGAVMVVGALLGGMCEVVGIGDGLWRYAGTTGVPAFAIAGHAVAAVLFVRVGAAISWCGTWLRTGRGTSLGDVLIDGRSG